MVEKLGEEEMLICEKLRHGETLIGEGSRLRLEESRETIQNEILMYTERKQLLDEKLMEAKKM